MFIRIKFCSPFSYWQKGLQLCRFLLSILLFVFFTKSTGYGQNGLEKIVNASFHNTPLGKALRTLEGKTGMRFTFGRSFIDREPNVNFEASYVTAKFVLRKLLKPRQLTYEISETGTIIILPITSASRHITENETDDYLDVKGYIYNEKDEAVSGVSVLVQRTMQGSKSDENGFFTLHQVRGEDKLIVSSIGYQTTTIAVNNDGRPNIRLLLNQGMLDEVVITSDLTSHSRHENPGVVSIVNANQIAQPVVGNVNDMVRGRVPGWISRSFTGVSGIMQKNQLEGPSSIGSNPGSSNLPDNEPLYIVDGVEIVPGNKAINLLRIMGFDPNTTGISASGLSPISGIDIMEIDTVQVLKDAAATSIYGSKGANGVVLITTKGPRVGKTQLDVQLVSGISWIAKTDGLLNTSDYVAMRREALANDNQVLSTSNAGDLLLWDTTKYTNFKKTLWGGHAAMTNAQVGISGGKKKFSYRISSGFGKETTVLPADLYNRHAYISARLSTSSDNDRFQAATTLSYRSLQTQSAADDPSLAVDMAPNGPTQWDSSGHLLWQYNGVPFNNPLSYLRNSYHSNLYLATGSLQLRYQLSRHFSFRTNTGLNRVQNSETSLQPISAQNSNLNPTGSFASAKNGYTGVSINSQAQYTLSSGRWHLTSLIGTAFEQEYNRRYSMLATGYTNDSLLNSLSAASNRFSSDATSKYVYEALFGAIDLNFKSTYFLYLTGRRDGSSQFRPQNRFGNFGAVSLGWIFTNSFIRNLLPFLRFGKLKMSYGTTGNDQVGIYPFLETWSTSSPNRTYAGMSGLTIDHLYDSSFSWEVTKKWSVSFELEVKRWLEFSATFYDHRSSNQVVSWTLPSQTGVSLVTNKNIPAMVQNTGLEFLLTKKALNKTGLLFNSQLVLTFPKNMLLKFPGLATSPYANSLQIGQSLTMQKGFHLLGVDPESGMYVPASSFKNGVGLVPDTFINGNLDPKIYGSLAVSLTYNNFKFEFFVVGKQQLGINPLCYSYINAGPGKFNALAYSNQLMAVLQRWQKKGDKVPIQRFSSLSSAAMRSAIDYFINSDRALIDASYLQLSTISLSYTKELKPIKALCRFYVQAQNVLTLTSYHGADPLTQNPAVLPLPTSVRCGLQLTMFVNKSK